MFFIIWTLPVIALYALGWYMGFAVLTMQFLFLAGVVFVIHDRFVQVMLAMAGHGVSGRRKLWDMPITLFITLVILCVFTAKILVITKNTNMQLLGYGVLASTVTIILSWYLYVAAYTWYYCEKSIRKACSKHGLSGQQIEFKIRQLRNHGMFRTDPDLK